MKKIISITMALLLTLVFSTGTVMAKSDNGNGCNKNSKVQQADKIGQGELAPGKSYSVKNELKQELKVQKSMLKQAEKTPQFSDTKGHWASQCINDLAELGLLTGYPDGSFDPDGEMTQAEALSLIMSVAGEESDDTAEGALPDENDPNPPNSDNPLDEQEGDGTDSEDTDEELSDAPEWAKGALKNASQNGIVNLNRFHSNVQANRAQVAVMLAKALEIQPVDTGEITFADSILISPDDLGYILALQQEGILCGDGSGNFNPNNAMTRAQMAQIIMNLLSDNDSVEGEQPSADENTGDMDSNDESGENNSTDPSGNTDDV